jgi:hypothetical protein
MPFDYYDYGYGYGYSRRNNNYSLGSHPESIKERQEKAKKFQTKAAIDKKVVPRGSNNLGFYVFKK